MSQQFYPIFVRGPLSKAYIKVFGLTRDILLSPLTGSQRYAQNPEEIPPQGIIPPQGLLLVVDKCGGNILDKLFHNISEALETVFAAERRMKKICAYWIH